MNITPISNYHFNSYKLEQQNKPENTSEKNTEYNQNKKYISYPANYYISFGNNLNISLIEQMQKTKDKKKLIELFRKMPQEIQENCEQLVLRFEKEKLSLEDYIKSCIKQPSLFWQSPDKIESNVRNLVKKFEKEGLNSKDYLKACVKQPPLFCQSPDTIAEHINIMKFSNINSKSPLENNNFWEKILKYPIKLSFSSLTLLVKNLIIPKMFENTVIPKELKGNSSFVPKLKTYLENHPDNIFELNVKGTDKDIEVLKKCIDELCDGKNNPFTINHIK